MAESPWWEEVRRLERAAHDGQWKRLRRQAPGLAERITARSWHHPDLRPIFAELALYEALAVANLGDDERAVWLWHTAQNIYPPIRRRDLSSYGRAAKLFAEYPLRARGEVPYRWSKTLLQGPLRGRSLERPKSLEKGDPPVVLESFAVRTENADRPLTMELILDEQGRPHEPVVYLPPDPHPAVVYAVLRTVPRRRFAPGRLDGEPRPFLIDLKIRFRVLRGASEKRSRDDPR